MVIGYILVVKVFFFYYPRSPPIESGRRFGRDTFLIDSFMASVDVFVNSSIFS